MEKKWFTIYEFKDLFSVNDCLVVSICKSKTPILSLSIFKAGFNKPTSNCNLYISDILVLNHVLDNLNGLTRYKCNGIYDTGKEIVFEIRKLGDEENIFVLRIIHDKNEHIFTLSFHDFIILKSIFYNIKTSWCLITMLAQEMDAISDRVNMIDDKIHKLTEVYRNVVTSINDKNQHDDFNSFIENNITSIPDDESLNKIVNSNSREVEFKSIFIDTLLDGRITSFESMMMSLLTEKVPIVAFIKKLNESYYNTNIDDINTCLPDISNDEFISLIYLSTHYLKVRWKKYLYDKIRISNIGLPVYNYTPSTQPPKNVDLALDLLLIVFYIKLVTDRLSSVESDSVVNKSLLYLVSRMVCDPFIFSFIDNNRLESIINCIIEKWKFYKNNGFFSEYENLLKKYSLLEITDKDLSTYLFKTIPKVVSLQRKVVDIHAECYKKSMVKSPPLQLKSIDDVYHMVENESNELINNKQNIKLIEEPTQNGIGDWIMGISMTLD